jgi:hypothetical protein
MNLKIGSRIIPALLIAAVALLFLPLEAASAKPRPPEAQQPPADTATLKENTDWLKEKIAKHASRSDLKDNRQMKLDNVKFDECNARYEEVQTWDMGPRRVTARTQVSFSLKDVNPADTRVTTFQNHPSVAFGTKEKKETIEVRVLLPSNPPKSKFAIYVIPFRDAAIAQQIGKVFLQAVKLCQ